MNVFMNCSRVIQVMKPDPERTKASRYIHIILFTLLIYPLLNALSFAVVLSVASIFILLTLVVCFLFLILKPAMEIKNLSFRPSRFLLNIDVPKWLVRVLMVPLYPLNFLFAIGYLFKHWDISLIKDNIMKCLSLVIFFILLPCLMLSEDEDDE